MGGDEEGGDAAPGGVADGDVDQAGLAADPHPPPRPGAGQGPQPAALSPSQDRRDDLLHDHLPPKPGYLTPPLIKTGVMDSFGTAIQRIAGATTEASRASTRKMESVMGL